MDTRYKCAARVRDSDAASPHVPQASDVPDASGCCRDAGSLAGSYDLSFELLAAASPATAFGRHSFFGDIVHVSA
jgi:hypothetical protein